MTLPTLHVSMMPAADGNQRISDPRGEYLPGVTLPQPENFSVAINTANSQTLQWSMPNGVGDATSFLIQVWITGASTSWTQYDPLTPSVPSTARSVVQTGLQPEQEYGWRIAAIDGEQVGKWSTPVWQTTPEEVIPGDIPTFADRTHLVTASAPGGGNGTEGSPWTLKEACENCAPGMIIGVSAGVYVGTQAMGYIGEDSIRERHVAFHPRNSGTEQQPIYFIAEHPAAKTLNQVEYSDIRSGATEIGSGWPAFGQMGYGTRPRTHYIHWIGMYSDDRASNNRMYGGGTGGNAGQATIAGCWGNGNYCSFRLCRLIRGRDLETVGQTFDNKSHFRNENCTETTYADNHLSIVDCAQQINSTCWTIYKSTNMYIHNNTCESNGTGICLHVKAGDPPGPAIEGIRYFNNRSSNFYLHTRIAGPTIFTPGEVNRSHVYGNLAIGGTSFFNWTSINGVFLLNGLRFFNNTLVNLTKDSESAPFTLGGNHHALPELNPRDISFYNNIAYNVSVYIMTNYDPKTPPGLPWLAQFAIFDRNCVWGNTRVLRGADTDTEIQNATWEDWTGYTDPDPLRITDNNSIKADPDFADTTDYKLNPGSPCATLGRDYYGFYGPAGATIPAGCYVTGDETMGIR